MSACELYQLLNRHPRLQGYQRAGLLSAEDVSLIQRVAGQKGQAEQVLEAVSAVG
jgi:hypothetical protein